MTTTATKQSDVSPIKQNMIENNAQKNDFKRKIIVSAFDKSNSNEE